MYKKVLLTSAIVLPMTMTSIHAQSSQGIITASSLNARSGASTSYSIKFVLHKGDKVNIITSSNGWYKITTDNNKTGWVSSKYVEVQNTTTIKYVSASSLNMRKGPSTSYSVITTLTKGEEVEVISEENGWAKINHNSKTGYVSSKYLSDEKPVKITIKYVNADSLNVREGAGTSYKILGTYNHGDEVKVVSIDGNWAKIQYKDGYAYILNKKMDLKTIFKAIEGKEKKYISNTKITVLDGQTIPEYASIISKQTGIDYNEIIQKWTDQTYLQKLIKKYWFLTDDILSDGIYYPLEGYLAPETYFLTQEDTIESITKMMLDQTQKHLEKYKTQILDFKVNSQPLTVHQFMTLSSIVQRESPVNDEDRQLVCGVLINRLNKQMPLQCDVTVNYGNQEVKIDVKHTDLNKDTKYNTYKYNGLPVGPISSISTGIIKNVLNYKESEYYYFFATQDGKVLYAKTYQEHQANVNSNKWY